MEITESKARSCLDSRVLQLIIMPTEACNFRCVYCYEEFKLKRMDPKVVQGVKNLLDRRGPDLGHLGLSWFGGEPLLAADIIEDVLEHTLSLRRRYPDLHVFSNISTNAFLLSRSRFERLLQLGLTQYQITFDGPREHHNKKRVLAGGGGTFDKLWGNLMALRDVPGEFAIWVRVHIDGDNLESLPTFVTDFSDAFRDDARFKLFFRQLSYMGGPNDHQLSILNERGAEQAIQGLRLLAQKVGVEYITSDNIPQICYAARGNSFVVRADGRLNKCTVVLDHPKNQVGRILEDGTLQLEVPKVRMWMRGLESGKGSELECPMHGYADSEDGAMAVTHVLQGNS